MGSTWAEREYELLEGLGRVLEHRDIPIDA
jgi:hypothetical protein